MADLAKYPELNNAAGVSGKRFVVYINYGENATEDNPVWLKLGGVKEKSLNITLEVSEDQTEDTGMWSEGTVTSKSGEFTTSLVLKRDAVAQDVLRTFVLDDEVTSKKQAINFALVDLDTKDYRTFWAIPNSWNENFTTSESVGYELTATLIGGVTEKQNFGVA